MEALRQGLVFHIRENSPHFMKESFLIYYNNRLIKMVALRQEVVFHIRKNLPHFMKELFLIPGRMLRDQRPTPLLQSWNGRSRRQQAAEETA